MWRLKQWEETGGVDWDTSDKRHNNNNNNKLAQRDRNTHNMCHRGYANEGQVKLMRAWQAITQAGNTRSGGTERRGN